MLRGIHKASTNWLGKGIMAVVLGLLVVSFAIWGIGDIFRGFGLSALAKVGSTEIGIEQFRQIYNDRLQQISRQVGRPITPDQARGIGLDRRILGQLVAETALDERARKLRLGLSDAEVAKRITADPSFQGPSGKFDRTRFDAVIRQAGFTEPRFVAEQRRQILRQQLTDTLIGGLTPPKAAIDAVHRYQNEERKIDYVTLGRAQAGDLPAATDEVLARYYDERKTLFRAPEYRKVDLLTLDPAEIAKWTMVSDADVRKAYDDRRAVYATPERRHLQQITFSKPEEAQEAADRIKGGLSFDALAAERGLKASDIELGTITKSAIIDPAIADAAFALNEGEVSVPVAGRFGTALLRAVKVEPGQSRSYEQVAPEIRRDLAMERAKAEISSLRNKIEDELAAGSSIPETAQKLKIASRTIEAIDRSGRAPDGAPVKDLPPGVDLVTAAFGTDVGVENDPLQLEGGGYVWFAVAGITPSRERSLDEVKNEVEARWSNDEIMLRLASKSNEMLDKLKAGTTLSDLAAAQHVEVQTATGLKRGQNSDLLSQAALAEVFRTPKDSAGTALTSQPGQRIVFRVSDVVVPPLDPSSDDAKRIREALQRSMADGVGGEYVLQLENEIGTTINPSALAQVTGGSAPGAN
jgi:peptidyl-prolyl cis-trans isomerase D